MRARQCALHTFAFSSRFLKHAIGRSGQFILRCRLPEFHSNFAHPGPAAGRGNPTLWHRPVTDTVHEHQGGEIHKSNSGESPIASTPLSSYRCLHATSVHDSIHIHNQPPQAQRSQLTPAVYLPLCLPFAVIVTLLDVSLEQDAYLPLSLPDFASIYHSRLCLCRVLFSNAKPPLGAESVNGAHAAQGVAQ